MTTWIVAADEHRARIFEADNLRAPFREIEAFLNPEARLREQDLNTDANGRYSGKRGLVNGSSAEPDNSAVLHKTTLFSKSVSDYLDKARIEHRYDQLTLIAFPKFLGMLRQNMSKEVQQLVTKEVSKNISGLESRQIKQYVRTWLH